MLLILSKNSHINPFALRDFKLLLDILVFATSDELKTPVQSKPYGLRWHVLLHLHRNWFDCPWHLIDLRSFWERLLSFGRLTPLHERQTHQLLRLALRSSHGITSPWLVVTVAMTVSVVVPVTCRYVFVFRDVVLEDGHARCQVVIVCNVTIMMVMLIMTRKQEDAPRCKR